MTRAGFPTLIEYSSGSGVETLRLRPLGLELGEQYDEPLARLRILDLRAPVRHAHGVVAQQNKDTPVVEDSVADPHLRLQSLRTPQ